jgi:phosphatidylserine/phosphatidylglycerophosphate/cardiolipin synthase-like enzyme
VVVRDGRATGAWEKPASRSLALVLAYSVRKAGDMLDRRAVFVLPLFSLLAVACTSVDGGAESSDEKVVVGTDAPLSYVGKNVFKTLTDSKALGALQGKTWQVSAGNSLDDGWLLPTFGSDSWGDALTSLATDTTCKDGDDQCDPDFHMRTCDDDHACPSGTCAPFAPSVTADGQEPKQMCVGYADWFEESFYDIITSAQEYVDITSLWLPTDRFMPAIRNALARLAARGNPITVRILAGDVSDVLQMSTMHTSAALAAVTQGLPDNSPLKIYVAEESASLLSWNHSKIVAADGKIAMAGGHNMHTADYQEKDPVSDLSMKLTGPAAAAAHRYANQVWDVACARGNLHGFGMVTYPDKMRCPAHYEPAATPGHGNATVIAAGRLGAVPDNASDAAILAMVDAAKTSVVMSQEDLLGGRIPKTNLAVAPLPKALLDRLAAAIGRGVDVSVIISNVDGGLFTTSYSHGWTAAETAQQIADYMKTKKDLFPAGADVIGALCKNLHVAGIRVANMDKWPDGKVFSNHAKFLMIDTQAFYVGSQNLYSADLAEFGFIVDSADAAQVATDTFWGPLWAFSQADAVPAADGDCPFK